MSKPEITMQQHASYPKIYRPSIILKIGVLLIGAVLSSVGVLILTTPNKIDFAIFILGCLIIAIGVFMIAILFVAKVTLYQDRIEQTGLFKTNTLRREDIQGYRRRIVNSSVFIDLLPKNAQLKQISVTKAYAEDRVFKDWLLTLFNMDAADQMAADTQIAQDHSLGATPEARKAKLVRMRKKINYLTYCIFALVIGVGVFPSPAWLVITILILGPWISIGILSFSNKNYTIIEFDKQTLLRKISLVRLLVLPVVGFFPVFMTVDNGMLRLPLDIYQLILPAFIGGCLMLGIILMISRGAKLTFSSVLMILPSLIVYAGGVLIIGNVILDHFEPKSYVLKVQEKYATTGKGAAKYFNVISTDPSYQGDISIKIPYKLYQVTNVNDNVCAQIHPGAFGFKWETVDVCF